MRRRSFGQCAERKPVQVLSALVAKASLMLGQLTITDQDGDKHDAI